MPTNDRKDGMPTNADTAVRRFGRWTEDARRWWEEDE